MRPRRDQDNKIRSRDPLRTETSRPRLHPCYKVGLIIVCLKMLATVCTETCMHVVDCIMLIYRFVDIVAVVQDSVGNFLLKAVWKPNLRLNYSFIFSFCLVLNRFWCKLRFIFMIPVCTVKRNSAVMEWMAISSRCVNIVHESRVLPGVFSSLIFSIVEC